MPQWVLMGYNHIGGYKQGWVCNTLSPGTTTDLKDAETTEGEGNKVSKGRMEALGNINLNHVN